MTNPTPDELLYLRTHPQRTDLYLSIYKPPTIFLARVNDVSITKGARLISYDTCTYNKIPSTGVYGMTLYVGTTPQGKEKGSICVLRDNGGNQLTVVENDHINWADNDYLTIVNFFQIWPLYPRVVLNTGTSNITVYMNYDEAYVTGSAQQNTKGIIMNCMGPHHAAFLDPASQQTQIYFTYDGSDGIGNTTGTTFSWLFEGGTPTGSTASVPGYVTWDTPGFYTVSLTTQFASAGYTGTFTSYRHISIYNRPEYGTSVPILKWGLESLSESRDDGGCTAKLWVEENISDVVDGALVILFADDWYGTTKINVTGNATNRWGIFFVGYILGDTIQYDYQKSRVTFSVGSPTIVMKRAETFSVSLEDSDDPTTDAVTKFGSPWYYRFDLTVRSGIYHYVKWHTTVNLCVDVRSRFPENWDKTIQYFDVDRSSIYDALNNFIHASIYGNIQSDRQGTIWIEQEASLTGLEYDTVLNMDKMDWLDEPQITENQVETVSQLEVGGVWWNGYPALPVSTPYLSIAPGVTPAYHGKSMRISGLALSNSQSDLNILTGDIFAKMNARYPEVDLGIVGNYQNLDIAPFYLVKMTMNSNENVRGLSWSSKNFTIQSMVWTYKNHVLRPDVTLTELTKGFAGDTVVI